MEATASSTPEQPQKVVQGSNSNSTLDSALPIIKALLPKFPLIAKTALFHTLGLSSHAKEWDLRTELTINVLRSFIDPSSSRPEPISKTQKLACRDPGLKGRIWVATASLGVPAEDEIRAQLFQAIEDLKEPGQGKGGFKEVDLVPVEAEWTGYRAGATRASLPPRISEAQKYQEMMREVSSPITVLYFHGGAFYLMDPSSHRPTVKKIAKLTRGRVLSVRYRLAPQNPFPSALLDALVAYFNLLYPAPAAFHEPVEPRHIVFAGDSAGANLCLVLLQTLLHFRRVAGARIRWNGVDREIPLPAGVALNSAWGDVTLSSPSCDENGGYDYLPVPQIQWRFQPPPCRAWPADPPRMHLYCEDAFLCHPLVSPIIAPSWEGSCPIFVECGQELLTDDSKYVAARAAAQGVTVVYEEFEAMPHCFGMLLEHIPGSVRMFQGWVKFIEDVVVRPETLQTIGKRIKARTLEEAAVDVKTLRNDPREQVLLRMQERVKKMASFAYNHEPLAKL